MQRFIRSFLSFLLLSVCISSYCQLPIQWANSDTINPFGISSNISSIVSAGDNGISAITLGKYIQRWDSLGNSVFKVPMASEYLDGVKCDLQGNTYAAGAASDSNNSVQQIVIKLDETGNIVWKRSPVLEYHTGGYTTEKMVVCPNGVIVTGWYNFSYGGEAIVAYRPNGTFAWQYQRTDSKSRLMDFVSDLNSNIIIGTTINPSLDWFPGRDAVIKLDSIGREMWEQPISSDSGSSSSSITVQVDEGGNIYGAGYIGYNSIISKFTPSGARVWTHTEGNNNDMISEINISKGGSVYSVLTRQEDTSIFLYYDQDSHQPVYDSYRLRSHLKVHKFSATGDLIGEFNYMINDSNYAFNLIYGLEAHSLRVFDNKLAFYGIIGDTTMIFELDTNLNTIGIDRSLGVCVYIPVAYRSYIDLSPLGFYAIYTAQGYNYRVIKFGEKNNDTLPVSNFITPGLYYSDRQLIINRESAYNGVLNIYSIEGRLIQKATVALPFGGTYVVPLNGSYATGIYAAQLQNSSGNAITGMKFFYK